MHEEPDPGRAHDHVRQAEVEADPRFSMSARIGVECERADDADRGDRVDRERDGSPSRVARRTLGTQEDVSEERAEEPEDGAEERQDAEPLRRLAQEVGRKRSRTSLRVERRWRRAVRSMDQLWSRHRRGILCENPPRA
jgi:hypothetical protein